MSAGGGSSTPVFGGMVNLPGAKAAGAAAVASSDDRNCAGVSGAPGARLLVSLQAQSSPNPAAAKNWTLTGGTKRVLGRRNEHRLRRRTDLTEDFANVLVQRGAPRGVSRDAIIRAGQKRRFWQTIRDLCRTLAVAHP